MLRCLIALLPTLLLADFGAAQPVVYDVRTFGEQDGLPVDVIGALHQDSDGFVWAALTDGVARFDGYRWRVMSGARDCLTDVSTFADADQTVWTLTRTGTLCRLDVEGDSLRVAKRFTRPQGEYRTLLPIRDGFWAVGGSADSLHRWTFGGALASYGPLLQSGDRAWPILAAADSEDRLWVAYRSQGVRCMGCSGQPSTSIPAASLSLSNETFSRAPLFAGGDAWFVGNLGTIARVGASGSLDDIDVFPTPPNLFPRASGISQFWLDGEVLHASFFAGTVVRFDHTRRIYLEPIVVASPEGVDPILETVESRTTRLALFATRGLALPDGQPVVSEEGSTLTFTGRHVLADETGAVWVGSDQGLSRIRFRPAEVTVASALAGSGQFESVTALPDGSVWVSRRTGLHRVDASGAVRAYRYTPGNPRSLSSVSASAVHQAASGDLWVGTNNGVSRYAPDTDDFERHLFYPFGMRPPPPAPPSPDQSGLSSPRRPGQPRRAPSQGAPSMPRQEPSRPPAAVRRQRGRPATAPPYSRALQRRLETDTRSQSDKLLEVRALASQGDTLWMGGKSNGRAFAATYVPEDEAQMVTLSAADSSEWLSALAVNGSAVWAGAARPARLMRYDGTTRQFLPVQLSADAKALLARSASVASIYLTGGDLCALADRGVLCLEGDRWHVRADVGDELAAGYVADDAGAWLALRSGMRRIEKDAAQRYAVGLNAYLRAPMETGSLISRPDGSLAIVSNRGVLQLDPTVIETTELIPPRFAAVEMHGRRSVHIGPVQVARTGHVTLPSYANAATFRLAGDRSGLPGARFAYRIPGLVDAWVDLDTPELSLAGLPPGEYALDVRRRSPGGAAPPLTSLALTVSPRLAQTWWFRLLLGFAALGAVGAAFAYRDRVRRRREHLRQQIADDLHDDLGARMGALALRQELVGLRLDDESRALTSELAQHVRGLSRDLRDFVWYVDSAADTLPAIAARIASAARDSLPPERLTLNMGALPTMPVDMSLRRHVLLIVKEAVHNAQRHAPDAHVEVTTAVRDGEFCVEVCDDGPGLLATRAGDGRGLRSMRRRASAIGALLDLSSRADGGTMVSLRVPLQTRRDFFPTR